MNDRIEQILAKKGSHVEVIAPEDHVMTAVELMNARRIGSLLVISNGRLAGILTERDLLKRVLAARLDPATTLVRDVMTRELIVVGPQDTLGDALAIITRNRCRHLPVVDGDKLLGMVSAGDLNAWLVRDQQMTIYDLTDYICR